MTAVLIISERPAAIAFGFVVLLVVLGGLYNPQFLSAVYLLQQLQVASFLGITPVHLSRLRARRARRTSA